ncbi:MAG: nucleotidyltransferase domain-containing protein [Candidatus Ozemobacteraceae bacterium]
MNVNLEKGRSFLSKVKINGRILLCGVTGSHFYGFPAPDSDLDLKGIHVAPTREMLGLFPSNSTINLERTEDGMLYDYTSNEIGQALWLLLKGNGNMIERLFSSLQLYESQELTSLREFAPKYLSRKAAHHYRGFFKQICEQHTKEGLCRVKSLLYTYRAALTGVHLLITGAVVGDVCKLGPIYGFPEVMELVQIYQGSSEKKTLKPEDDSLYRKAWPILLEKLEEAEKNSILPEEPADPAACSEWLVSLRLKEIRPE